MAAEGGASGAGGDIAKDAATAASGGGAPADEVVKFDSFQAKLEGSVTDIVKEVLGELEYDANKVAEWSGQISERSLSAARECTDQMKFVVSCLVLQLSGSGMHSCSACFWDKTTDGCASVKVDTGKCFAVVNVFGMGV